MEREPSSSGRSSRTTTHANPFLEWIQNTEVAADKPAATAVKVARTAKPERVAKAPVTKAEPVAEKPHTSGLTIMIDGEFADDEATVAGSTGKAGKARPTSSGKTRPVTKPRNSRPAKQTDRVTKSWWRSGKLRGVVVLAVVAAVAFSVYSMGRKPSVPGISGPTTDQSSAASGQLDQAKVASLMTQLSANPKDKTTLQSLGDVYFAAGDYKTASTWEQKILALEPKNLTALLALGACQFNLGDTAAAEKNWLTVVKIAPRQAEAHYDLGFLYLSKNPPDMAKVRSEWNTVVAIDPKSDIAKTVQSHLQSLNSQSPSASASSGK
jgi:cytochrome c-type biogenesis protein CcmH/NrfG